MSWILRLPLNADLPRVCMTCGSDHTHLVVRTFRHAGRLHRMQVPACAKCASQLLCYPRWQSLTGLLITTLLVAATALLCLEAWEAARLALFGAIPPGLSFLRRHWRFERCCLGIGSRFILLRVGAKKFVEARNRALEQEHYLDWFERLRCEGHSPSQIAVFLEGFGVCSRLAYESAWDWESQRRRRFRAHGWRRLVRGLLACLVALVGGQLASPLSLLAVSGTGWILSGGRQMLSGSGFNL
ncbi:MAG: hypothetical protein U0931_24505 [Vulcanimicrobiota bacterium]